MQDNPPSEARNRVLEVAEQLFMERGYAAVKLRDIADALGIRQASLYHHVPGGKEALFVEVTKRGLERHQAGLTDAIQAATDAVSGSVLHEQLMAAAGWLMSQPSMNFGRMFRSDMPSISEENAHYLGRIAYRALMIPLQGIFYASIDPVLAEDERRILSNIYAGSFLTVIEGFHDLPDIYAVPGASATPENIEKSDHSRQDVVAVLIDLFINGIRK